MSHINRYKNPGAKRLMREAQELSETTEDYCAQPINDNLFEWHFTVRGPPDSSFDGGFYHGRLTFPTDYPMRPPSIILLTPNGRFETNKKICLSISGFHPETWQPSWSVRTALLALIAFMPTKANGAIGSLDLSNEERVRLADKSKTWRCESCGLIKDLLRQPDSSRTPENFKTCQLNPNIDERVSNSELQDGGNKKGQSSVTASDKRSEPVDNIKSESEDLTLDRTSIEQPQDSSTIDHSKSPSESITPVDTTEQRSANSSMILKSIVVLLLLLVFRRILIMV